jgi:serine/threonine-protein kinase
MGGFERLVVIKRLRGELAGNERAVKRILAEARLAASIHHANVVATQHVGIDAQGPYLVLDYVEGASLEELVEASRLQGAPLPVAICLRIALDALSGLSAIHDAHDSRGRPLNILHRDLSLQNVLVGRDGVARIADFGIAKSAIASGMTEEGYLIGKLHYLSPEYLRRENAGATMDVYALGVTLWLAITGKALWPGAGDGQVMHAILTEGIPTASTVANVPPAVDTLLARACASWPEMRFDTARAMAEEIERVQRELGMMATHREVAERLEALVGHDLSQRRKLVASMLEQQGPGERLVATPGPRAELAPESSVSAKSADSELPAPLKPRRFGLLSIGMLTFLAVAALAAMLLRTGRSANQTPTSNGASPDASLRQESIATAREPIAVPPSVSVVPIAPVTLVPSAPAAVSGTVSKKPVVSRRSGSPRTETREGARAPDDIKSKNPYRRRDP